MTHVYDGDTILVDMDGALERFDLSVLIRQKRMTQMSTCSVMARKPPPTQAIFCRMRLSGWKATRPIRNRDRYDRLLRYVYSEDEKLINKVLIEQGFAFAYTRFPFLKKDSFVSAKQLLKLRVRAYGLHARHLSKTGSTRLIRRVKSFNYFWSTVSGKSG